METLLRNFVEENKLNKKVFWSVVEHSGSYSGTLKERMEKYMNEVLGHGCVSGIVGELIYYSDTVSFFEEFEDEIAYLVDELCNNTGESIQDLFINFDTSDPFVRDVYNQNMFAWFGYEETCNRLMKILEEL